MNAIYNNPYFRYGIIALLLLLSANHFLSDDEQPLITDNKTVQHDQTSDYSMNDFTMTIMDKNGQPSQVIKGQKMAHYPETDQTKITAPIAEFISDEEDIWVITSEHGTTQGKGETILLTDNVIVTRKDNNEIELHTSKLNLDTQKSTAYTDAPVKMISPYGETNSVGLHATLNDKTINLHSKVKGHYDAPPPQ